MMEGIRSLLFMPADNARAHAKATTLAADAILFDLEDAVAEADKASARDVLRESLRSHDYGTRKLYIRINHPDHVQAGEDIALLAEFPQLSGLIIPKVEDARHIHHVAQWMQRHECPEHQHIAIMLETPKGVLRADAILSDQPLLRGVIAGTNDLAAEMHLPEQPERQGLQHALSHIVLAARAHGLSVFDGVYNRLNDADGLKAECLQGKQLGFDGKTLIHPAQLDVTNVAFSPSESEIANARNVIAAWQAQSRGVTHNDGQMVEELHVRSARRILALSGEKQPF
jgi:citrate lyase subunit beta / citryl-CoA lyase